ncbi:MAG: cob(I)yrinic acid a,c-diamide adenosyltransferase [bacterium]|nr:cob(I)yrinic acid a,c-diamide adenosyltransferase [bacterium]
MRIYTKTGDNGTTGMFGAGRIPKYHPRVAANGDVDELNAWLGLCRVRVQDSAAAPLAALLARIQNTLFSVGAQITTPQQSAAYANIPKVVAADITWLEAAIDRLTADLPELTQFILPGGSLAASMLHVARTVCRRAERSVAAARAADIPLDPLVLQYLNRMSDLLFTMARWANRGENTQEIPWKKGKP